MDAPQELNDLPANPLLIPNGLPRFGDIRAEHVEPAVRHVVAQVEQELTQLEQSLTPTWDGLLKPLEELGRPLEMVWRPVSHLLNVQNTEVLRKVHQNMLPLVVELDLRLMQSRPLYEGLRALRDGDGWRSLTGAQQRVVENKLRDAQHAGVGLDGEARERFKAIESELSLLTTDFDNHILDATKAFALDITDATEAQAWPESLRRLAAQSYQQAQGAEEEEGGEEADPEEGPWRITLDLPSYFPFIRNSTNRSQREQVYRAYLTRASTGEIDNRQALERILALRREKARLLGFETYAELSLSEKMAGNVDAVETMFRQLEEASRSGAQQDLEDVRKLALEKGQTEPVAHWDTPYWDERLRERRFGFTEEDLRPYFPLAHVLAGLFELCQKLFGIVVKPADGKMPVWHEDVRCFAIEDTSGRPLASFYLDPYSRPNEKRGGAWMAECLDRRWIRGNLQLPVVFLCCNGTPPLGERPSLMTFREVETLFHEFGHGLQGMLTTVDFVAVAGLNGIEHDAIELASQFMENWCYFRPTLMGMAQHYETGETLPEDLYQKICAARTYRAGTMMMRQLEFGMIDMELHHRYQPGGERTAEDVHREVAQRVNVLPPEEGLHFLCGFSHIFAGGYSAGYFSYKWAEVLSADAFSAFEEVGLENDVEVATLGRRYRDTILALGGSRHPMDVYREFRGRQPTPDALLRHNGLAPALTDSGDDASGTTGE